MRKIKYKLFLFIGILLISIVICRCSQVYDYDFYVSDSDIHVFTKKKLGGKFLIMFAKDSESLEHGHDVDYLETEIGAYIRIIFEKTKTDSITIHVENKPAKLNQVKYKIEFIDMDNEEGYDAMIRKYYVPDGRLNVDQYQVMRVDSEEYHVSLDGEILHRGNFLGR